MKIKADTIVIVHYTIHDQDGNLIDQTEKEQPLSYLHGHDETLPGIEFHLEGKEAGERVQFTLEAEDAFGPYDESLVQEVPKATILGIDELEPGMRLETETEMGPIEVLVVKIDGDKVTLDANNPLAGRNLGFDVEILEVREATQQDLENAEKAD